MAQHIFSVLETFVCYQNTTAVKGLFE